MEISKAKISRYSLLRHKKYRDREGLFMVQGSKAVSDTMPFFSLEALIENKDDIRKVSTLENLPEVVAIYRIPVRRDNLSVEPSAFSIVLDGVQDPGNLGTIIRTAHWFGVRDIFCSPDCVDLYNPKVVQATMGSLGRLSVTYCDLQKLLAANPGVPLYGLLLSGENIFTAGSLAPGFLLFGSEGHGPSPEVSARITTGLTIPPRDAENHPESLNVGIAAAITLSQLIK
ncbi:MAG: RNA methyltransferase [Muribaculaceae bacterium]|nr:RNA methyltransferase [Muribaculaceae bacterium]